MELQLSFVMHFTSCLRALPVQGWKWARLNVMSSQGKEAIARSFVVGNSKSESSAASEASLSNSPTSSDQT